jgi:arsenate reductase (thioredoxin)
MRVLILCTGNSARSQMAAGWLRHIAPELDVLSAGTKPAARVHRAAVRAMAEIGIDISAERPRAVDTLLDQPFDFVVTVCGGAREICPLFRGPVGERRHIGFDDPAASTGSDDAVMAAFRTARERIREAFTRFYHDVVRFPLRAATDADVPAIRALLAACALPLDGVEPPLGDAWVVAGDVVAVAGVERYGSYGLLRSVAVAAAQRSHGIGARMLADRIAWSRATGLHALYLLTTTAESYFARVGFVGVPRAEAPPEIRASGEFAHACPHSAAFMRLAL